MFCKKCGNKLNDGSSFCNKCGYSINQKDFISNKQQNISSIKSHNFGNKKLIAISITVIILATIPIISINIKQKGEYNKIEKTIQHYSKAISSLNFNQADSYCEYTVPNVILDILDAYKIPVGTIGNDLAYYLGKYVDPINYTLTRHGKIRIKEDLATVPVNVKIGINKDVLGVPFSFVGMAEVNLINRGGEWLIQSIEMSDLDDYLENDI